MLDAIGQIIVAVFIDVAQIAGSKPALLESTGGLFGLAPVTRSDGGAFQPYFTGLTGVHVRPGIRIDDSYLQARERVANRPRFAFASEGI